MRYRVSVRTADEPNAGTDCSAWLQLFGHDGASSRLPLEKDNTNRFERGANDVFDVFR